ncbi:MULTISPECIES: IS110 family transposase [unclassified Paracoccus (in: a-proteobacteria)]|uniref:IS110 family transposase n=1 Tax=unclassified Paracoccus (in: a-proteobacteria) TaxID=2688777 RepID=UPI001600AC7D|nr:MULTISPECIES: IS110 family transposase [unclassified Paracoccus (in: a-proteobacteria)]MBB1493011.1 IS110 family transposase [Paracoccus sp. MC1854]MBB1499557.1 IS110 family transposase [Paracoccus sp. MC1862]QQO46101.1 IS110 family transposase [Paracoccus sp. MC1862]
MKEASIIGVDLAKHVFQLHGATAEGEVVFRKKLSRKQFVAFMRVQPGCCVAMEACATAHHWARTLMGLGHEVRLIAPKFVKPYVKNRKNDMADAEAITEAASRPTMRFVEVKTPEQQGLGMIFRLRDLLVGQRTQTINALRGHLAEFGLVTGKGRENVDPLRSALERDEEATDLPVAVHHMAQICFAQIDDLSRRIAELEAEIAAASRRSRFSARLQTMPGVGPVISMALAAFAPPMESFRRGRDFPAWLGLVSRQHSSGSKQRLGRTSKSGQRDIRRLLIIGAMAVISGAKARPRAENSWLGRILARKPRMLAAIAPANKMARMLWAMITKDDEFRGGPLLAH